MEKKEVLPNEVEGEVLKREPEPEKKSTAKKGRYIQVRGKRFRIED